MAVEGIGEGKIVPIEVLRQRRAPRAGGAAPGAGPESAEGAERPDRAGKTLSAGERRALMAELRAEMKDLPEVRRDKVIEAKLRISTGYYNREEVRREILRSLVSSFLPEAEKEPARSSDPSAAQTDVPAEPDRPGGGKDAPSAPSPPA